MQWKLIEGIILSLGETLFHGIYTIQWEVLFKKFAEDCLFELHNNQQPFKCEHYRVIVEKYKV